jgi:ABC-2 type transport system ATP-binding protein
LEKLNRKRLLINAYDLKAAQSVLSKNGYTVFETNDGKLELKQEIAISKPDAIATIMVNAGCPPTLLQVEEEDLESYFLRTINENGGV